MRCPACGARNGDGAAWCTQCFADLRGTPEPPPGAPEPSAPRGEAPARDVRTVGDEVEWHCRRCGSWTPLGRPRCGVCDAPREGFGEAPGPDAVAVSAQDRLTLASVLLPGLGHLLAGRVGSGVARLILGLSWLIGGVAVVRAAGVLPAAPLLVGALVVWAASIHDVRALVAGRTELLRPRVLTWLTVGVLGVLLVTMAVLATVTLPAG